MVLLQFIESSRHGSDNNLQYWENMFYSGKIPCGIPYLTGWITVFSFFGDQEGPLVFLEGNPFPQIGLDQLNPNVLLCPAIVDDNGLKHNAMLFVGQMSFRHEDEDATTGLAQKMIYLPPKRLGLVIEDPSGAQQDLERSRCGIDCFPLPLWELHELESFHCPGAA